MTEISYTNLQRLILLCSKFVSGKHTSDEFKESIKTFLQNVEEIDMAEKSGLKHFVDGLGED